MKKSMSLPRCRFAVAMLDNEIIAEETVYPSTLSSCGVEHIIELDYNEDVARATICRREADLWNKEQWVECVVYIEKAKTKEFFSKLQEELERAEDFTQEVHDVYAKTRKFICDNCEEKATCIEWRE